MATKDAVRTFQADNINEAIAHGSLLFEVVQVKPNSGAFAVVPFDDDDTTSPGDTTGTVATNKLNHVEIALFSSVQSTQTTTITQVPAIEYVNNSTTLIQGICPTTFTDLRLLLVGTRNN